MSAHSIFKFLRYIIMGIAIGYLTTHGYNLLEALLIVIGVGIICWLEGVTEKDAIR